MRRTTADLARAQENKRNAVLLKARERRERDRRRAKEEKAAKMENKIQRSIDEMRHESERERGAPNRSNQKENNNNSGKMRAVARCAARLLRFRRLAFYGFFFVLSHRKVEFSSMLFSFVLHSLSLSLSVRFSKRITKSHSLSVSVVPHVRRRCWLGYVEEARL